MSSQRYISDTLKKKKKKVKKVKTYLLLFAVLAILVGLISLTRLGQIQITKVNVQGNAFVSTQEIKGKADAILKTSILGIIPRSNIFIFPKGELQKKLKENPAVLSASVQKDLFNTLHITIVEQEKQMVYCTSFEWTECFYVNGDGFVYARITEYVIPEQEIIIFSEGETKKLRDTILEKDLYSNVVSFVRNVTRSEISLAQVIIKQDGVIEFVTRDQTRIITSKYDDFEKDFQNMMAVFEKEVLKKEQLSQIEYMDLRFGNKVFYKNRTY